RPVFGLAWGVLIGGVVQVLFQIPFLHRLGLLTLPRFRPRDDGVRRILKLMLPAIFGVSVSQINLLFDTLLASFLVTGSVSWLYYSDRLVEFPLGIFGVALATVILPTLSRNHSQGSAGRFSANLDWALRWSVVIGIPSMVGLILLSGPLLTTLFQYGAFTTADVRMASLSLVAYSLGLMGFILVKVLAPGFFARQDTRTPVRIAIIAMVANMVMNLMLIFTLAHVGLALATSLGALINAGLLYRSLRQRGFYTPGPGWGLFVARTAGACVGMAVVLWYGVAELSLWIALTPVERMVQLLLWVSAGALSYVVLLLILGFRPRMLMRE
ncbi:MAG: murein biosynthesis integral membrane protein MurJ, partial [Gammaproteobacteria bacterium]|nr:murein biosynthesis integral membrane protein MurJ [Gammaproteobacteria bacterium]